MRWLWWFILLGIACGASWSVPEPGPDDARRAGVTEETLAQGRRLYVFRCGGCHRLYPPSYARRSEWQGIVQRMGKGLASEEVELIQTYLSTFALDAVK